MEFFSNTRFDHNSLLTAYCLLLTAYCLLLTTHHCYLYFPSCITTLSFSIIVRNSGDIAAQSTISTLNARSASSNAAVNSALSTRGKGASVIITRSRSEYFLALPVTREPKAQTEYAGTCS